MALEHWLRLALTEGIGPIFIRRIIDATGSAEAACSARHSTLETIDGIGRAKARAIHESLNAAKIDEELEKSRALGVTLLCPDDTTYPALLHSIPDPPAVLYVKGAFEPRDLQSVAIVGS